MSSDAEPPQPAGDPKMPSSETQSIAAQIRHQFNQAPTSMLTTCEMLSRIDVADHKIIAVLGKMEDVGDLTSRQCQSKRVWKLVK